MAFPSIVGSPVPTVGNTATTAPAVLLPPLAVGTLGLMWIRVAAAGSLSFTGWTALVNAAPDASTDQVGLFYRVADGTEGANITGASGSARFAAIVWEITGALHPSTQAPQLSLVAVSTTGQPNALAVTPTGGAKEYLYGVLVSCEGEQTAITTYPDTNAYNLGQQFTTSLVAGAVGLNVTLAGAWRQLNAASADPGAWTIAGTLSNSSTYAIALHPALVPTITDVEGTEIFLEGQTAVTITGTNFEAAELAGVSRVELANSATYATATKVSQTVTSWAATSIDFTASLGGLTAGALFLYVTNRSGATSAAIAVTVNATPTITDVETTEIIMQGQTGVTITGTNFLATQGAGTVELADGTTYATATKVAQAVTSWGNTAIDFTVNLGGLSLGTRYVFVTSNSGLRNAAFAVTAVAPGAAWLAALNTPITVDVTSGNVQLRLRVGVTNSGSVGATAYKWRYWYGVGPWADVTASSPQVRTVGSSDFADGDDVPQLITSGPYQTDNNAAEESTGAFTLPAGFTGGASVETEIALEVIAAAVNHLDTLEFIINQADNTELDVYTETPLLTISKAGGAVTSLVIPVALARRSILVI